ncbi:hypothetical protein HaLaN_24378, partial [Haematococcus lacustris]
LSPAAQARRALLLGARLAQWAASVLLSLEWSLALQGCSLPDPAGHSAGPVLHFHPLLYCLLIDAKFK